MKRLRRKRNENRLMLAAVAVVVSCAAFLALKYALRGNRGVIAEIYHKTRLVRRIDLRSAKESVFSIPGLPNVIFRVSADGSIAFERSDCPDQICVRSGKLSRRGQIAACLPNDVYIRLVLPSEAVGDDDDIVLDEEAGPLEAAGNSYEI
ncbi:MAG: NusG domain II-containing protein [Clostridiales bacterium]|nr:NusG domain II-containing protein [Clostridiales bacterium]